MLRRHNVVAIAVSALGFATILLITNLSRAYTIVPDSSGYHVAKTIPIGGGSRWDYCVVDTGARRLYVSHGTEVVVLDADTYAKVAVIADTQGVHGIALAPDMGRGFTSNGRTNDVTIFDLKTLKTIGTAKVGGQNPDAIFYDARSKRVFTFNGESKNATAINAADGSVAGTFSLGGRPEFAAGAGDGRIFANIEDKSELIEIDAEKLAVLHRWSVTPCKEPSGLAMDIANRRLFAVCGNSMMAVVNADTGKVVATSKIDDDPDAAGFDPGTHLVFSSNGGAGNLTVVRQDSPDKYTVVENVPTKKYARTMALDLKTHNIFLPIADFTGPAPEEGKRPAAKPNSFGVLLVTK
jgi:DNA-binding beta-propeller fold protein YncE